MPRTNQSLLPKLVSPFHPAGVDDRDHVAGQIHDLDRAVADGSSGAHLLLGESATAKLGLPLAQHRLTPAAGSQIEKWRSVRPQPTAQTQSAVAHHQRLAAIPPIPA